jgi:hypothetical protein
MSAQAGIRYLQTDLKLVVSEGYAPWHQRQVNQEGAAKAPS